jgi:predicted ATP-grasp superfamily ATP-dependent carboligase
MRVFVYEYLCCGGMASPSASLAAEGRAMLAAVLDDFRRAPGASVTALLAPAAAGVAPDGVAAHVTDADGEGAAFRRLAAAADYTLAIAPEFGGLLEARCRWAEEAGGRLLGPSAAAVRLAADKAALAVHLRACGVPTPPCVPPAEARRFPAVLKPRDGAGSQATFLVHDETGLQRALGQARAEGWAGELVAQPYVPGEAAGVAFLVSPGLRPALPPAAQDLSTDGRFRYRGGRLPLPPDRAARAVRAAERAVAAVDGLRGYVGVDVVLGEAADGGGDAVIEVNPRLTTSYVGLRALARFNLAEAMLAVVAGKAPPAWEWGAEEVCFSADGSSVKDASAKRR